MSEKTRKTEGRAKGQRVPAAATRLKATIQALLEGRGGLTVQELAAAAAVSPNTITALLAERFGPHSKDSSSSPGSKQLQGWAEALTRLAMYLRKDASKKPLDPEELVAGFGIDLSPVVRKAINRVRLHRHFYGGVSDPVLEGIAARSSNDSPMGKVRAGFLRWPPFVEDDEHVSESWAWQITRRWIACVNPEWAIEEEEKVTGITTIEDALGAVLDPADPYDLVFGMYDTPYRRMQGLDFVRLPGLGVPLGILYCEQRNPGLSWDILLDPHSVPSKAVVIDKEVGHLFLRGALGYPPSKILPLKTTESESLAKEFAWTCFESEPGESVIFAADAVTCARVRVELRSASPKWPDMLHLRGTEREDLIAQMRQVEDLRSNSNPSSKTSTDKQTTGIDRRIPVYRLGISIRADARRWKELLEAARDDELFRNAVGHTAQSYVKILQKAAVRGTIRPIPLQLDLPAPVATEFLGLLKKAFEKSQSSPDWLAEFASIWNIGGV